jgi:hypothetical protein
LDVHQHLWNGGGGKRDVNIGQVREEEIHGGMEVRVRTGGKNDEQIPEHCDQVHG